MEDAWRTVCDVCSTILDSAALPGQHSAARLGGPLNVARRRPALEAEQQAGHKREDCRGSEGGGRQKEKRSQKRQGEEEEEEEWP